MQAETQYQALYDSFLRHNFGLGLGGRWGIVEIVGNAISFQRALL